MKKNILIIFLGLGITIPLQAQGGSMSEVAELDARASDYSLGVKPAVNPFSLIDFSRVKWSHSYSVNYFSGGFGSGSVGNLNTSMYYEFTNSLSMTLNLGIAHDLGGNINGSLGSGASTFLPGFNLDYHPSENFRMSFSYQQYQGYQAYNRGYGSRFLR